MAKVEGFLADLKSCSYLNVAYQYSIQFPQNCILLGYSGMGYWTLEKKGVWKARENCRGKPRVSCHCGLYLPRIESLRRVFRWHIRREIGVTPNAINPALPKKFLTLTQHANISVCLGDWNSSRAQYGRRPLDSQVWMQRNWTGVAEDGFCFLRSGYHSSFWMLTNRSG